MTVNAAEDFLGIFFKDEIRNLAGKKILIIGIGNIGFKLSLRLIERGCGVELYKRDVKKTRNICRTINSIKPNGTLVKAVPIKNLKNNLVKFDIIFCAANKVNVLEVSKKTKLKKNVLFIDIGKGMFDYDTQKILRIRNIHIHRLDVTPSLNMLLESASAFRKFEKEKTYKIKKIKGYTLVSPGLLGQKNELIIDNPDNPKIIYGICDGHGDFIKLTNKQKLIFMKKISKTIKKKIYFN